MAETVSIIINAKDNASAALKGIGSTLGDVAKIAGGILTADIFKKLASGVMNFVGDGLKMDAMLEKTTIQFTTLMGSSDKAAAHVKDLFKFAAETPFETEPIIKASKALLTFGGAALDTNENLKLVGDAAAAAGQNIDEVAFWTGRAYSMIKGGQPFGEAAMRLQEMGILSAEARAEMEKLQKQGKSADQVWAVMTKQFGKFNGAMKAQAGTWEGLTSTISDNIKMLAGTAFKPFFDSVKVGMGSLATFLQSNQFTKWAEGVAASLTPIATAISNFMTNLGNVINFLGAGNQMGVGLIIGYLFGADAQAKFEEIVGFFQPLIDAFKNLFGVIIASAPMVQEKLQAMWDFLMNAITTYGPVVIALLAGFFNQVAVFWAAHGETIMTIIQGAWQLIITVVGGALILLSTIINAALALINGDTAAAHQALATGWAAFMNLVLSLVGTNLTEFNAMWTNNLNMLKTIVSIKINEILNTLRALIAQFIAVGKSLVEGLRKGFAKAWDDFIAYVTELCKRLPGWVRDLLGISSPSKVFAAIGKNMMEGMTVGIKQGEGETMNAAGRAARNVTSATYNSYNLTINEAGGRGNIVNDFGLLKALAGA